MDNEQLITACLALVISTSQWTVADVRTQAAALYTWVKTNQSEKYDGNESLIVACLWNAKNIGRWDTLADIKTEADSQFDWALGVID
jgi:hypothetical protein